VLDELVHRVGPEQARVLPVQDLEAAGEVAHPGAVT
jgi:hypothetical protein